VTREELELATDIPDLITLFYVLFRHKSSRRFVKTENIKCVLCLIIVTFLKAFARVVQGYSLEA